MNEEDPPLQTHKRSRWDTGSSKHVGRRMGRGKVWARGVCNSVYWGRGGELDRVCLLQVIHMVIRGVK